MSFNIKQDLKVYTSDTYNFVQDIGRPENKRVIKGKTYYGIPVRVKINKARNEESYNLKVTYRGDKYTQTQFGILGSKVISDFDFMVYEIRSLYAWLGQNPKLTWEDLRAGQDLEFIVGESDITAGRQYWNPTTYVNRLAIGPRSNVSYAIGRNLNLTWVLGDELERNLFRAWVLFGVSVPEVIDHATYKNIMAALHGHDFGITHAENLEDFINLIGADIHNYPDTRTAARAIKNLDKTLAKFGGTPIVRQEPENAYIKRVYKQLAKGKK